MFALRRLFRTRPHLFGWIVALALAVRLIVPAGHMPAVVDGQVAIVVCPGSVAAHHMGKAHHDVPAPELPCAFAGLAAPMLGAVDAVLLAVALAFVAARALHPVRMAPHRAVTRWRPPLRAPPILPLAH